MVGAPGPGLVDRRAVRRGVRCFSRWGRCPAYVSAVGARWDSVTYFIGSLFFTSAALPHLPRSGRRGARRPGQSRPPAVLRLPATAHRLVGNRGATRRDAVLQRQHRRRDEGQPDRADGTSACVAPRRRRLGLLPGGQRTGLVRGLPRLGRLAAPLLVLVDHAAQPARVRGLRRVRGGRLHQPGDRPAAERRAGEPGHPGRRGVLPRRRRCCCCRNGPRKPAARSPRRATAQAWRVRNRPP